MSLLWHFIKYELNELFSVEFCSNEVELDFKTFLLLYQIDKARDALGAKALTQRQIIDEIERKADELEERNDSKKK